MGAHSIRARRLSLRLPPAPTSPHAYQSSSAPIADADTWREFRRRFAEHLDRFGHGIYDLDFAKSLAADEPAPLLEALKFFLTRPGAKLRMSDSRQPPRHVSKPRSHCLRA